MEQWHTIDGDPPTLERALRAAQELEREVSEAGGWSEALRLGMDAEKPRHAAQIAPVVLAENRLDRSLAQEQIPRGTHGPGPVRVSIRGRRIVRPAGNGSDG